APAAAEPSAPAEADADAPSAKADEPPKTDDTARAASHTISSGEAPRRDSPPGQAVRTMPVPHAATDSAAPVPHASPSVRKFARELGVDLYKVRGSGAKQRITQDDVRRFVKDALAGAATAGSASG